MHDGLNLLRKVMRSYKLVTAVSLEQKGNNVTLHVTSSPCHHEPAASLYPSHEASHLKITNTVRIGSIAIYLKFASRLKYKYQMKPDDMRVR